MKKTAVFLLITVLFEVLNGVPSLFSVHVQAEESGVYAYTVISETAKTCRLDGITDISGGIAIPETIAGYTVTAINDYAFKDNVALTSIAIPGTVITMGKGAFAGCTSLNSVAMKTDIDPDGDNSAKVMTEISDGLFEGCSSLGSIALPPTVEKIGNSAFKDCTGMNSIALSSIIKSIGSNAFFGCKSLTGFNVGSMVETIGDYAFSNSGLTAVVVSDSVRQMGKGVFSDCPNLASAVLSINLTKIESGMFENCRKLSSITIPDFITIIGANAFKNCSSLSSIGFPETLTAINDNAFNGTAFSSVYITKNISSIGDGTFSNCPSLIDIKVIHTNFEYFDTVGVLFKRNNELVKYPEARTDANYEIPSSTITIRNMAFENCSPSLTSISIPQSTVTIGDKSFINCPGLSSFTVHSGNTVYSSEDGVLYNKNRTSIIRFPQNTAMTSFTITDTITSISPYAFAGATNLISVIIPNTVKTIGENAFNGCAGITIYGYPNSAAEEYAQSNNLNFVELDSSEPLPSIDPSDYYIVQFDSDGGSKLNPQLVEKNSKLTLPKAPSKKGYIFAYWTDKKGAQFDSSQKITSNLTLKAKWIKKLAAPILMSKQKSANRVKLSWNKFKNASGYIVYRSSKKRSGYKKIKTITVKSKTKVVLKKQSVGKPFYKIRAFIKHKKVRYNGKISSPVSI